MGGAHMEKSLRTPIKEIIGTWRILYEAKGEEKPFCMCRCLRCGVKKIIPVRKFLKGYVLNCPECRIRQDLTAQ